LLCRGPRSSGEYLRTVRGETADPDGGFGFGPYFVDVLSDEYGGAVDAWNRDSSGAAFESPFERI